MNVNQILRLLGSHSSGDRELLIPPVINFDQPKTKAAPVSVVNGSYLGNDYLPIPVLNFDPVRSAPEPTDDNGSNVDDREILPLPRMEFHR